MILENKIAKNDIRLNILLFNIMGYDFAMPLDTVTSMQHFTVEDQNDSDMVWFHDKIVLQSEKVLYRAPKILCLSHGESKIRLIVDNVPGMPMPIDLKNIRAFPGIMEPYARTGFLWGVYLLGERMILLVDAYQLIASCRNAA